MTARRHTQERSGPLLALSSPLGIVLLLLLRRRRLVFLVLLLGWLLLHLEVLRLRLRLRLVQQRAHEGPQASRRSLGAGGGGLAMRHGSIHLMLCTTGTLPTSAGSAMLGLACVLALQRATEAAHGATRMLPEVNRRRTAVVIGEEAAWAVYGAWDA